MSSFPAVVATLATTVVLGIFAVSVPGVVGEWSVTLSESPSAFPAGQNATATFTVGNSAQDPITVWSIDFQFDWMNSGEWGELRGKWGLAPGQYAKAWIVVAVPDAVGSHTLREQVWANETGKVYPTVTNFTQAIEIVSPNSVFVFPVDLQVALMAVVALGVVGAVLVFALFRESRLPPR